MSTPKTALFPSRPSRTKAMMAATMAATALRPRKSVVLRSAGLPAWARRRSVRLVWRGLVTRCTAPESRSASGRTVRSKNGCWSSSSSRGLACIEPSCVRRGRAGMARPRAGQAEEDEEDRQRRDAGDDQRKGHRLDLDVHDLADGHEAEEHEEATEEEDDQAEREPEHIRRLQEHRVHEAGGDDEEGAGQADGQEAHHVARHALLRGEGPDLALDAHPLADGVGDRVEDLGQVAADLVLDGGGGGG